MRSRACQRGSRVAYSHFLSSFGNQFGSGGEWTTWLLAIGSLVVGFGPLVLRRPTPFLAAGGLLATFFWVSGQGLGGIFTGSGTDPNSGPLVVLLALAMVPAVLPDPATWVSPLSTALFRYPVLVVGSMVALLAGLFLSAAYPVAAQESTSTAMAGMTGMSGASMAGSSGQTAATASCTSGNNGAPRAGLDINNTPNMIMAGPGTGMNMNGADASAAAGLNTTKANWHYTGPALPTAEAQELLAQGANGPTDIHMSTNGCASEPTFSQEINAIQYVQTTSEAVARFTSPAGRRRGRIRARFAHDLPRRLLRESDHRGRQRSSQGNAQSPKCGRPRLRPDTFGPRSARRSDVPLAINRDDTSDALRPAGAMAPTDRRVRPKLRIPGGPAPDHRDITVSGGERPTVHSVHDHGLAGTSRRWSVDDSATRYPDRRGLGHGVLNG